MSVMTAPEAGTGVQPPAQPTAGGGLPGWLGSWRVSLRMARRDVRRHKGRSIVVLIMVGLPIAILSFVLTMYASTQVRGVAALPYSLGSAQASLSGPDSHQTLQYGDEDGTAAFAHGTMDTPALLVPDWSQTDRDAQTAAIGTLTQSTVVPINLVEGRATISPTVSRPVSGVVTDLDHSLGSKLTLDSGRWPRSGDEIAVTPLGVGRGIPSSGPVTLTIDGSQRTVTIVGRATYYEGGGPTGDFVADASFGTPTTAIPTWYLLRDRPVDFAEQVKLNEYGFTVLSADVVRNPPTRAEQAALLPTHDSSYDTTNYADTAASVTAGGIILLMLIALLVAPAFAVSASRQRRTLALVAAAGATTPQLRRTVLAQAVVLGALAGVVGAVVGVLATYTAWLWIMPRFAPNTFMPTVAIPWLELLPIVAVAVVASLIAAMIPALRLGRLDIVGVMKGQNTSPRLNRVLPVIGAGLAVIGGAIVFKGLTASHLNGAGTNGVALAAVAMISGALMLVPAALVGAGRLSAPLPVALRLAARDNARQRQRATGAVAAVLAAVAAFTMIVIPALSDADQRRGEYSPTTVIGEGVVTSSFGAPDGLSIKGAEATIQRIDPHLEVVQRQALTPGMNPGALNDFVLASTPDCPPAVAIQPTDIPNGRCTLTFGLGGQSTNGQIAVLPAAEIMRRLHLPDDDAALLRSGALVARAYGSNIVSFDENGQRIQPPPLPTHLNISVGTYKTSETDMSASDIKTTSTLAVPVIAVDPTTGNDATFGQGNGALIATEAVPSLQLPMTGASTDLLIRDPRGDISDTTQQQLEDAFGEEATVYVERGYQDPTALMLALIVGSFSLLVLIITLTSTALTMAERRADDATLAAVGGTRRTRRALAGGQAFVTGLVGTVLGMAVGFVPGIALAHSLTRNGYDLMDGTHVPGPIVTIPWFWLAVLTIGVPLLAAAISAAAIRKAPQVTRRMT